MTNLTTTSPSTNNGWDLVSSANDSGLTQFVNRFIPKYIFFGMPNTEGYNVYTSPSEGAGTIINAQNMVKITIPITGTPRGAGDPPIEAGSTMSVQFDVSQMILSKKEDDDSDTVYISWKSSDISLSVTSSLIGGVDEATFNNQMEVFINMTVLPKKLPIEMNVRFGVYGKIIKPTYWNFITLANGNSFQVTALTMFDYKTPPSGDQNAAFQNDSAILVPDDGSNLIVSLADYTLLEDVETLLIKRGFGLFDENSFEMTQDNGQSKLSLINKIALVKNLFIYLLTLTFKIVPKGLNFLLKLTTPVVILDGVTASLNAVPEQSRDIKGQPIDMTFQDAAAPVKPNIGCIVTIALFLILIIVVLATVAGPIFLLIGVLLVIIAAVIVGYIFKGIADNIAGKLLDKMQDFQKTRYNKNPNFFIKNIVYDEAVIMQGIVGNPDIKMSIVNGDTQTPVIYSNVETFLDIKLINNSNSTILLNDSTSENPTTISIQLPDFFNSNDYASMFINQEWNYQLSGQTLLLTNKTLTTWEPGSYGAISVFIGGVTCSNETNASGSVVVTVENTSYQNEIEVATRLSVREFEPNLYPISWEIVDIDQNGFEDFTSTSGTTQVNSTTNTFIVLTTATLDGVTWEFGYQFTNNAKGQPTLAAILKSTGVPSQKQNGDYLPLDSEDTSTAKYKGLSGNTGIAINFTQE
jgi:hypothetical protein